MLPRFGRLLAGIRQALPFLRTRAGGVLATRAGDRLIRR